MVNKALRIVLYTIFTISLLFVVPFNNIHADTLTTSNITYNYYLSDVVDSTSQLADKNYIYDVDFNFDKSYLGWVSVSMITSYIFATGDTRQATYTKAIYINGNNAHTSIVISSNYNGVNGSPLTSMSITVNNSNVTPMADISTLDDILNVLIDINGNIEIDVIDELQNIVQNTSLANQYLDFISKYRQYNFPIESLSINLYPLMNFIPIDYNDNLNYIYPLYKLNSNDILYRGYIPNGGEQYFIFASSGNISNTSQLKSFISFNRDNIDIQYLSYYSINNLGFTNIRFNLCKIINNGNNQSYYMYLTQNDFYYIPIYLNDVNNKNLSIDFALQWGLKNDLLNNIEIIANGTNASSAASSQSDQANSQLQQDSNTLFTQEDTFKQNMNSAMQNIDTTFSLNNFGSSFMSSAQWVRTQYETLTNNTPFASLITFSLLVGLALIVIGKVYK